MIAYIIGNQNLLIFNSMNLTILSQISNLNSVNIFMQVGYKIGTKFMCV